MNLLLSEFSLLLLIGLIAVVDCQCSSGCDLALASYYVWQGTNLSFISQVTQTPIQTILNYNPQVANQDSVLSDTRINVPFACDCIGREFLGHVFTYDVISSDTYNTVAQTYYSNLTTAEWLARFNSYPAFNIPDVGARLNVTVNCSCGDAEVSKDYGLFVTYPLRPGENLASVAAANNLSSDLVQRYNPTANSSASSGLLYIPGKDQNGVYPPLTSSKGLSGGVIAGITVAGVAGVLLFAGCFYFGYLRKKNIEKNQLLSRIPEDPKLQTDRGVPYPPFKK